MSEKARRPAEVDPTQVDPVGVMRSMRQDLERQIGPIDVSNDEPFKMCPWLPGEQGHPEGRAVYIAAMTNDGAVGTSVIAYVPPNQFGRLLEVTLIQMTGRDGVVGPETCYWQFGGPQSGESSHLQDPDELSGPDKAALFRLGEAISSTRTDSNGI